MTSKSSAQVVDEKSVSINMDLQPILKLDMSGQDNIDFTFDNISSYVAGITKYNATILRVSASVNWDLYAVAQSTTSGSAYMDNQVKYSTSNDPLALSNVPLDVLEIHQQQVNTSGSTDYSQPFQNLNNNGSAVTAGQNNVFTIVGAPDGPYVTNSFVNAKFINGGATDAEFEKGGSYLTTARGAANTYEFNLDYRIAPGLPVVFPTSETTSTEGWVAAGNYAMPGMYTMEVKYVLIENQ